MPRPFPIPGWEVPKCSRGDTTVHSFAFHQDVDHYCHDAFCDSIDRSFGEWYADDVDVVYRYSHCIFCGLKMCERIDKKAQDVVTTYAKGRVPESKRRLDNRLPYWSKESLEKDHDEQVALDRELHPDGGN